jgi:glycosyltransferase involved in cell wall biosynthesis
LVCELHVACHNSPEWPAVSLPFSGFDLMAPRFRQQRFVPAAIDRGVDGDSGSPATQPDHIQLEPSAECDVSVVVPTHNREGLLTRTLDTLVEQRAEAVRYEILVVDNNSSDGTRAVVEKYARAWPGIRYFFEGRPGVSHARNTGIAAARAPIIAFIDDDVEADPAWVERIKRTLDAHPEVDCVGGKIEARWSTPPPAWLTAKHWGPVALQAEKGEAPYIDAEHASACLMTANFACRRAALDEVGGFSADFLRDEDRELQMRLWAAGKRGMYDGAIVVTTEVPAERMTKRYHRDFNLRVGASHQRMRYRDRLSRDGRLVPEGIRAATLFGVPGFIYRSLLRQAAAWVWSLARLDPNRAFFHETRILYFASYIWHRIRDERPALSAVPRQSLRFATSVLLRRVRARAGGSGPSRWSSPA